MKYADRKWLSSRTVPKDRVVVFLYTEDIDIDQPWYRTPHVLVNAPVDISTCRVITV